MQRRCKFGLDRCQRANLASALCMTRSTVRFETLITLGQGRLIKFWIVSPQREEQHDERYVEPCAEMPSHVQIFYFMAGETETSACCSVLARIASHRRLNLTSEVEHLRLQHCITRLRIACITMMKVVAKSLKVDHRLAMLQLQIEAEMFASHNEAYHSVVFPASARGAGCAIDRHGCRQAAWAREHK